MSDETLPDWKQELVERTKAFFQRRRYAYRMVFKEDSPFTKIVLADLAKFCRVHETCYDPDSRITELLEGRREVALRILHHLELNESEFWELYKRKDLE